MALLYTQAFDCDQNEVAAKQIASDFDGFKIDLSEIELGEIYCDITCYRAQKTWGQQLQTDDAQDWWMVSIEFPRLQQPGAEEELHVRSTMLKIRSKIYNKVKQTSGYRAAMFGCEAQDDLGDDEWLKRLDKILSGEQPEFSGLILKQSLTDGRQIEPDVIDFASGYVLYDLKGERS